jgi:predicted negative regulator of RcsB-dependent stress response
MRTFRFFAFKLCPFRTLGSEKHSLREKLNKDLPMNVPAEDGMKQNSLSFLKALLLTSATQGCPIKEQRLVTPKKDSLLIFFSRCTFLQTDAYFYRMRKVLFVVCLWIVQWPLHAQKVFLFNEKCQLAYHEIMKLKLVHGQQLLDEAKLENPDNLIPYFIENYIDFFTLFFNEDPDVYANRKENKDTRLDLMDEGSDEDAWKLYCKAVIHMQWAAVRIKFGERTGAGLEFRKGFVQIKDNKKDFPNFLPNNMLQGSMQVAIGTVPKGYRWLTSLFGLKGNIKDGMHTLTSFVNSEDSMAKLFREEAVFYYCYLKFYIENKPEEALKMLHSKNIDFVNNHLFTYQVANLSINNKDCEAGKQAILKRNPSSDYMPTSVWDLELGYAKLYHLDVDAATYLERFIANFKGSFYVKDVLLKLSWHYYLQGNTTKANYYKQLCTNKGKEESDADKKAMKDANKSGFPNPLLLKARLLNDGGYLREALIVLAGKSTTDFAKLEEQIEFNYRLGRIYDDMHKDDEAIVAYLATMKLGKESTEYYAARAAVQTGMIYERKGKRNQAIEFYQYCLDMGDHDYKNSLDQKAKAGIARCKGE